MKEICTSIQFWRICLPKPNKNDTRLATFRVAAKTENSAEAELPLKKLESNRDPKAKILITLWMDWW